MGRSGWLAVAASIAVLVCAGCGLPDRAGSANASCVGPRLGDEPAGSTSLDRARALAPGEAVTVYGLWYTSTCNDTSGDAGPLVPLPPVHLALELPGASVDDLGEFTPSGDDMGFSVLVRVPAGTPAGIAVVHDDRQPAAEYRFEVRE
jgi:hypothetical protein